MNLGVHILSLGGCYVVSPGGQYDEYMKWVVDLKYRLPAGDLYVEGGY